MPHVKHPRPPSSNSNIETDKHMYGPITPGLLIDEADAAAKPSTMVVKWIDYDCSHNPYGEKGWLEPVLIDQSEFVQCEVHGHEPHYHPLMIDKPAWVTEEMTEHRKNIKFQ